MITGVVNVIVPVPPIRIAPPVGTSYQSIVSFVFTFADMVKEPDPHLALSIAIAAVGGTIISAVAEVLVGEIHPVVLSTASA